MTLETKVRFIKGVGPHFEAILNSLNIYIVKDLIYYFPVRYESYKTITDTPMFNENELVEIEGTVTKINKIFTRNKKKLTKISFQTNFGIFELIWFNQHYIANKVLVGELAKVRGKVTKYNNKLTLSNPEIFPSTNSPILSETTLIPVYGLTEGLNSRYLNKIILTTLNSINIETTNLEQITTYENLLDFKTAIYQIHKPTNLDLLTKSRQRFGFEELLQIQLKSKIIKKHWSSKKSIPINKYKEKLNIFIKTLPFKLTKDQQTTLDQIINDLGKNTPANRIVIGDVGSGKTLVVLIASVLAVYNKTNVLYMAPTAVLAKQQYEYFKKYINDPEINISLYTNSKKITHKTNHITIGTHSLLFNKDNFSNIALVIIDEQQRFGVEQRSKLLSSAITPHLLTLTATPIPRSFALTIFGELDTSCIIEKPGNRLPIITKIVKPENKLKAYEWINGKIKNEKIKVFIICPFIEKSEFEAFKNIKSVKEQYIEIKEYFKDLKVSLLHGKLKEKEKESVVEKFRFKDTDILVSTPIIEVGIDIPEAGIILIESSERFGISSLHQMRGRVGRNDKQAYCLLSTDSINISTRLQAIEKYDDGFKLAEFDLKARGQGELLGVTQSGFTDLLIADLSDTENIEKAQKWANIIIQDPQYTSIVNDVQQSISKIHLN